MELVQIRVHDSNIYSYDPMIATEVLTVDATVGYQNPQSEQKFILMIYQKIHINGLEGHLLCPMLCCLNGVHISVVSIFLADSPSVTTQALQ